MIMDKITFYTNCDDLSVEYILEPIDDSNIEKNIQDRIVFIDDLMTANEIQLNDVGQKIDNLTAKLSNFDCYLSVASGVLTGIIDSLFVGEFSLDRGTEWGKNKVESFVKWVAKRQGYKGDGLSGAVSFLEGHNKIAADLVTKDFGGGLYHHLNDFSHHPTLVGLFFSILTQFTGMVYGTKASSLITIDSPVPKGSFISVPVPNGELIGNNFVSKITLGVIKWIFHMVSDMAGSSSSIAKGKYGTGLPGIFVSFLKELSSLPIFQDKENGNKFSIWVSKLFNGTLLAEKDKTGVLIPDSVIKFDLRAEIGFGAEISRQAFPVLINECIVRGFYFLSRLYRQMKDIKLNKFSDLHTTLIRDLDWDKILPIKNRTIVRMMAISSGTFTAIDLIDASVRAVIYSGGNVEAFMTKFLLRINIVGIGRFSLALYFDGKMEIQRQHEISKRISLLRSRLSLNQAKIYYKLCDMSISECKATHAVSILFSSIQDKLIAILNNIQEVNENVEEIGKLVLIINENNPDLANFISNSIKNN